MKPSVEQIGNLLALKRHERPEDGYWQDFLCEFHQTQRERAVKRSALMSFAGRVSGWFSDSGPSKWAYGAGLAYATVTVAFFLTPPKAGVENTPMAPVNYQVVPAPAPAVEQLDKLDLSPLTQGNAGEQVF
ncbi:MAG: hypothetical protein ABI162_19450 [Luteolibacter sp.]